MDAVQQSFYTLHFKAAFHEKKGTAFQDWFVQLAGHAHGPDFEEVRPYGKQGDLKCDGRLVSVGAIFQVYAPYLMKDSELNAKIREDFEGALLHWGGWLKTWIFVHNDARGLPPGVTQYLDVLRAQNPKVKIEVWSEPELLSLLHRMDLSSHQLMFGYAPSLAVVDRLAMQDLVPVIEALSRAEPSVIDPPLTPPSLQKLEKNSLSADAAVLLQMGRRKSDLVGTFFARGSRPDLGEHIAQAFREHYQTLKSL
ncbi:MAG: hypothetical protein ACYCRE_05120, partial [Acidobacteriaceae bacterium]